MGLIRLHGPIRVKQSGSMKGSKMGKTGRLYSPEIRREPCGWSRGGSRPTRCGAVSQPSRVKEAEEYVVDSFRRNSLLRGGGKEQPGSRQEVQPPVLS